MSDVFLTVQDNKTPLPERFDDHVNKAAFYENDAVNSFAMGDTYLVGVYMQRAQLHAALALAIAQRMTAENQEHLEAIADKLNDLVELKCQGK